MTAGHPKATLDGAPRVRRRLVAVAALMAVGGLLAAGAGTAVGAPRLVTIETPSAHVDPAKIRFNGSDHPRRLLATVMLPDGYDGRRRFPVLYLLHGVGDAYNTWSREDRGDVVRIAGGLGAIVVMPEAAAGFYTDWFNGGRRGDPGWERFYLEELIPLVERRYRIRPQRRWRAAAGLSMGGFGAAFLAGQLPGYFGSVGSFSGFLQHQRPWVGPGLEAVAGVRYEDVFGPMDGPYATGHNATRLVENLRSSRVFVAAGSGTAEPGVESTPSAVAGGGLVEAELRMQADEFVAAARSAGADVTYRPQQGVHDWPYWRRHLAEAIAWGLFEPVPESPSAWTYRTVAKRGDAWGLRYAFAAPPEEVVTLRRDGDRLTATGSGTVTITNAARCGFTAGLPFERALPPAICGRLRVSVKPRRIRAGRTVRLRVRVTREAGGRRMAVRGARISVGRRRASTDARGRATISYRARRAGRHVLRARVRGLAPATARLTVVRR